MAFAPIPEREEHLATLVKYLAEQPDGSKHGYVETEIATGIPTASEHTLLPRACRRLKRPYCIIRGWGIVLSSADNAREISEDRLRSAARKNSQAAKVAEALLSRHEKDLRQYDKNILIGDISLLGGFKAAMRQYRVARRTTLGEKPPAPMLPKRV